MFKTSAKVKKKAREKRLKIEKKKLKILLNIPLKNQKSEN